jgi:C1A family cysteine protease
MKKGLFGTKVLAGFVILLSAFFAASTVFAHDLDHIRAAIHEKGAHWEAGETSMSALPEQERKLRLGHVKPRLTGKEPVLAEGFTGSGGAAAAYTYFDWSDPMKNYVTPVRNQSSCGSCWAFAAAGALESYALIKNNLVGQDINLSEQVLVSCSGAGSCGGGSIGSASNYIRDKGLPLEGCFPYTATNNTCGSACYAYQSDTYRIQGWAYVATTSVSVEALKNALVTYGPLVTTMDVYADFFNYRSGVYSYASGAYQGGHAILIVGYDDSAQCFKAKNSWGTGWGEAGYFRIAYSAVGNPVYFGEFTIAYSGAAPQPPPPAPDPAPTACSFTISPTSRTFNDKGGKGSISVTTGAGCAWTATESADWVSFTSASSKIGSGTVSYSVAPNTTTSMRTTSIGISATGTSPVAGSVSIIEKGKRR